MQRVVTAEEMRRCDGVTIKGYGVPGLLLMENAGRGIVEIIKQEYFPLSSKHILIVCGKGNNGGDGFVIARLLSASGARISILLAAAPSQFTGDARTNFLILQKYSKKSNGRITLQRYSKQVLTRILQPDLIVDALFGTGFTGTARQPFVDIIDWMNRQQIPIIAVDIPSGVNGSSGVVGNVAVRATITATLGCFKTGLLCNQGRALAGSVHLVDIGIPAMVLAERRLQTALVESSDVQRVLPRRTVHAHKYSVGKILVLAGSKGLTGAASMCAVSALRAGAGAVMLGTPEPIYPILAKKMTEVMTFPLPSTDEGTVSLAAFESIREKITWADVLVLGPGLSQNPETQQLILKILMEYRGKVLLDADGLNAVAVHGVSKLRSVRSEIILTPHVGECARLTGLKSTEVEQHRLNIARDLSRRVRGTVVLKGVPTVTASHDGALVLNCTGNRGMATAGAGDVLSGIIAGLWAQGMSGTAAAWAGVFLHGRSGDLAAHKLGERSLMAHDLMEYLPAAFQSIEMSGSV